MRFAYYDRLSRSEQAVYRASDAIHALKLPRASTVRPLATALAPALATGVLDEARRAAQALADALCARFEVPPVEVRVLAERPRDADAAELHGLYTAEPDEQAVIRLWMRTAAKSRVVAFRTFLRTLLHELCHHIDFELYGLPSSYHTMGFYQRESSLFHQLVPSAKKPKTKPKKPD